MGVNSDHIGKILRIQYNLFDQADHGQYTDNQNQGQELVCHYLKDIQLYQETIKKIEIDKVLDKTQHLYEVLLKGNRSAK